MSAGRGHGILSRSLITRITIRAIRAAMIVSYKDHYEVAMIFKHHYEGYHTGCYRGYYKGCYSLTVTL